jgi:uncharacterized protein (TIGR03437 family)
VPFNVTSPLIDHDENAVLVANYGTSSTQVTMSLLGLKPTGLLCPQTLESGTPLACQVTLNSGQAHAGIAIAIAGNNTYLTLPSTVPTLAGQPTISFEGSTTFVTSDQQVNVTAAFHGVTAQAAVTLTPAPPVLSLPGRQTVTPGKVVTFTVSASDPAGLGVAVSVSGLPANASFNPNTGVFNWVPQTSQTGLYAVPFTATNLAHVSATENAVIEVQSSTPVISALANAASFADMGCSPGSVATLLGTGFVKSGAKAAETSPLPTSINGLRVQSDGTDLPVFYASEDQVNFQCPQSTPGASVLLTIQSDTGSSAPLSTTMEFATPGIFALDGSGKGQGAILVSGTANLAMTRTKGIPSQPAARGTFISIYAVGLGPTDVEVPAGAPSPSNPLAKLSAPVDVLIGGEEAEVNFAGLAPGYTGLYQLNARVPAATSIGPSIPVQVVVHRPDGSSVSSNVVTIAVSTARN